MSFSQNHFVHTLFIVGLLVLTQGYTNLFITKHITMFKKILIRGILLFALIILVSLAYSYKVRASGTSNQQFIADIIFKTPTTIQNVFSLARQSGLKVTTLESDYKVGSEWHHDFLPTNSSTENAVEVEKRYQENRAGFLQDFIDNKQTLSKSEQKEYASTINNMKATLADKSYKTINISKATATGTPVSINQITLNKNVLIEAITDLSNPFKIKTIVPKITNQIQTNTSSQTWYPNSGKSVTGKYKDSKTLRYVEQHMKWNKIKFQSNETYEHEFMLDNSDGKTYLNSQSTPYPLCFPVYVYAETNWPAKSKPYIDTRLKDNLLGCEDYELEYSMGVAQANQLSANKDYYTYYRAKKGNANSDWFKVQAQLGYRLPPTCYSVWCSFGRNNGHQLLQKFNPTVPGTKSWSQS